MAATELIDYKILESSNDGDMSEIEIISDNDKWHGVTIRYGAISAREVDGTDEAVLSYDFNVTNQNPEQKWILENDPSLQNLVGDILFDILSNAVESEEYTIGSGDN